MFSPKTGASGATGSLPVLLASWCVVQCVQRASFQACKMLRYVIKSPDQQIQQDFFQPIFVTFTQMGTTKSMLNQLLAVTVLPMDVQTTIIITTIKVCLFP